MKRLLILSVLVFLSLSLSAQFEAGDEVTISKAFPDDLYIAGGQISIDAPVYGDCVLAGGTININDSIQSDLIVGGGDIKVRGPVGDDIRVAGGTIEIDSEILDDLIVFGGQVKVTENALIHGNLVSYGGELDIDGTVLGAVKASGGEITVKGTAHGPASLSAGDLEIKKGARFLSDVNYWSDDGEVDFGNSVENGDAVFDQSLAAEGEDYTDTGTLLGIGIFFTILFLLGGLLILILLEWAFGKWFSGAAREVEKGWPNTLGVGAIYVIGLPVLVILSFLIVIGIPIGVFGLVFYIFTMVFGNFVAALALAHLWKDKKGKTWGVMLTSLIALAIAVLLQLLTSIPFLGWLISFTVLCITYGAIILAIRSKKMRQNTVTVASNPV